jgi:phage recombination protein Bet
MGRKDAPTADKFTFTETHRKMIRGMYPDAELLDADLDIFFEFCARRQLDPMTKQVVPTKFKGKLGFIITIDALRFNSQRTGEYEGQTAPQWCGTDGVWKDAWLTDAPPTAARVGVYRKGHREPDWGFARFGAYAQTYYDKQTGKQVLNSMWRKMGDSQLAKCAEALAHRKAFPEENGQLYTHEEMEQVLNPEPVDEPRQPYVPPTPAHPPPAPPPPSTPAAKPATPPPQAPATQPSTPAQAPASTPTAAADPVAYIIAASDKLPGGLNAVEQWCKQVLGESWLKVRRDPAKVARVVTALDAGGIGDYTPAKASPAKAPTDGVVCKCGQHVEGNAEFCSNCGDPIPDSKSVFRNGGAK